MGQPLPETFSHGGHAAETAGETENVFLCQVKAEKNVVPEEPFRRPGAGAALRQGEQIGAIGSGGIGIKSRLDQTIPFVFHVLCIRHSKPPELKNAMP